MAEKFTVSIEFSPAFSFFLRKETEGSEIQKRLSHATTVKDVIESCGVPHTEVGSIAVNGARVGFGHRVAPRDRVRVYPVDPPSQQGLGLQPEPGNHPAFIADEHLAKLARRMRVLGFDTVLFEGGVDSDLLVQMQRCGRILLTRDRRLLMHRVVHSGYCVRSDDVQQQVCEVVRRFSLAGALQPFSRCVSCNGKLAAVEKATIAERLEPKTRKYYQDFFLCGSCGKLFWHGSHAEKLERFVTKVVEQCGSGA